MSDKRAPSPAKPATSPAERRSQTSEIDAFVRQARAIAPGGGGSGRLILSLDATMSRQPTWDVASHIQAQMFDTAGTKSGLAVQLVYFRGYEECRASKFVTDTATLKGLMTRITCRAGHTQIGKALAHALKENERGKVSALVYIGDAMEESADDLADKAGDLGVRGVPVFVFQEGHDSQAEQTFREIARLSRGAWFRFDRSAAATLARLLSAVAVYATGGLKALEARGGSEERLLIQHLKGGAAG